MEEEDNSQMFKVDRSEEVEIKPMPFFDKNTQIIKEGQRHKVIFGQMEEEKKSLHQIVAPYLYKFAAITGQLASQAGHKTYEAIKSGAIWIYNKFVDKVVPYALQNLPKIIFVTKKKEENTHTNSSTFEVIGVEEEQYNSIEQREEKKEGKTRVVVPLGTENDKHFEEFLLKQKYQINYDFPIDEQSQQQYQAKPSMMMPSESYQAIIEEVDQAHAQLQIEKPATIQRRKAYKLQNCFIFEFEGQNSIEYDMDILDSIQKCEKTETGYIVFPEHTLRKSIIKQPIREEVQEESEELDPIGQFVQGKPKPVYYEEEQPEKKVDMGRKVHVDIAYNKPSSGEQPLLTN